MISKLRKRGAMTIYTVVVTLLCMILVWRVATLEFRTNELKSQLSTFFVMLYQIGHPEKETTPKLKAPKGKVWI